MKEWSATGINISNEVKLQSTAKKGSGKGLMVLRCLCLFVCMAGALLMAEEAFGLEVNLKYILPGLAVDCLILGAVEGAKGRWKIAWYVWNFTVFAVGIICRERVLSGYFAVENGVRGSLEDYYGINLALRQVPMEDEKGELFLFLVFAVLILALGSLVVRKGRVAMLSMVMLLFFALELLCGCRFQRMGVYLTAGSILALFAMGYRKGGRNQRILYRTGICAAAVILILTGVCGLLIGPVLYDHADEMNQKLYDTIQHATNKLSAAVQSQNGLFGNHTPTADGSLNNYPVQQDQQTDLRVTLEEKPEQSMYLRGFIGDTYEGTYWHRLDENEFRKAFPSEDAAYQIQNILYRYIDTQAGETESEATVERISPGGEYGYVPYGFETPDDANLKGDSYYSSAENENTYSGYPNWRKWIGDGASSWPESELEDQYRNYVADQYLKVPVNGLERLKEYCAQYDFSSVQQVIDFVVPEVKEGRVYSMDLEPVPDGEDFAEYFFFEQKKGYCIHYATTATLMFRLMGVPARYATGYVVSPDAFEKTGDTYTAEIPDSQAHAWVEVYRSGKGWIPLEVTPGYGTGINEAGTQDGQEQMEENLPQATPSPEQIPPELETPAPDEQSDSSQITPEPETQETEDGQEAYLQQDGENSGSETEGSGTDGTGAGGENDGKGSVMVKILSAVLKILGILIFILLLAAGFCCAVYTNRKRVLKKRKAVFFQEDRNRGICEISYELYRMLCNAGIQEPDCRDEEFARKMEKKLGCVKRGEFVRFVELVQQAAYGQEQLSDDERQMCYAFYRKIGSYLWQEMDRRKKLWWKYMKCYEIS